jgi:hypothetical protein
MTDPIQWHGTTILTVRKNNKVVIAGDGQVSLGQTVIKGNAKKVRPLGTGLVNALKESLKSFQRSSRAPASKWLRTGVLTAICAASKP